MNKLIYDEALKELTWLLHDEIDDNPKRSRLSVSERLNMFKRVKDVLEQAKKQEELLNKIKEMIDRPDFFFYSNVKRIKKTLRDYKTNEGIRK